MSGRRNPAAFLLKIIWNMCKNMLTEVIQCYNIILQIQKRKELIMKTIKETAKYFNVTEMTIRRWIDSGKLKAIKIVGTVRIEESEIERLKKGE